MTKGEKYIILNDKPIRCMVREKYFTSNKAEKLDVHFALFDNGKMLPIIVKKGMGMGAAVIVVRDKKNSKKDICGYFVKLENIQKVFLKSNHKLGFSIFQ